MNGALPRPELELGPLEAPVLICGGPYGNLEATEALLAEAARLGIPAGRTICTGDVAAYCADPEATARLIRNSGIHVVMGNCEESLAAGAPDCACGFRPGGGCDLLAVQWYAYAARELSPCSCEWMGALPRVIRFTLNGVRIAAVHGAVSAINRFVFASAPATEKRAEAALAQASGIVAGHCGLPFTTLLGDVFWHNAGAVGLPANDGTPCVWYSVLAPGTEDGTEGITITHHALRYDHGRAAAKMRERGLPEGYARALEAGIWPSLDVLPAKERRGTGRRLQLDGAGYRFVSGGAASASRSASVA
jgi:predicted phosphodiesterase